MSIPKSSVLVVSRESSVNVGCARIGEIVDKEAYRKRKRREREDVCAHVYVCEVEGSGKRRETGLPSHASAIRCCPPIPTVAPSPTATSPFPFHLVSLSCARIVRRARTCPVNARLSFDEFT